MNKYQILLEYVGTKYVGWQSQKNGRSIQNTVQLYLSKLLKKKITIYGAGRTDSGVHAIEQSAHFYYKEKLTNIPKLIKSLNFFLNKKEISILIIKKKNINFHARHSAKERTYNYLIRNSISQSVINMKREWHLIKNLDIGIMKKGAKKFLGTHDFSTYRSSSCDATNPIKTIKKFTIKKNKTLISIDIVSKSFLKSQVRSMVGCLKYLGEKKWTLKKFEKVLKSKNRKLCAPLAPSHGLYLKKVTY